MATLKDRISAAEQAAVTEKSPIADLFRGVKAPTSDTESSTSPSTPGKKGPQLADLPTDVLDEMEQPFRLYSNDKMEKMRQSIIAHGVIQRVIVRPNPEVPGRYQIISGRNRRRAAIQAGHVTVPCEIRDLTDEEARLQMLTTNLDQRDELLPSEKAWAYREQMEILAHQGKKMVFDESENPIAALGQNEERTSRQSVGKLESADQVGAKEGESGRQIQRYIRLTYLMPELLEAVDEKVLGFGAGVSLSYLSLDSQDAVYQYFFVNSKRSINGALAETLRERGEKKPLTVERIQAILAPAPAPVKIKKVSVPMKTLRKFFPAEATPKEIEKQIIEILTEYFSGKGEG